MIPNTMDVNGKQYKIIKLLGKGKGGYSYLATDGDMQFVLKQIHHEPCDYYEFGNKLEAEIKDYRRLKSIGITIPDLIEVDEIQERILKEYIDGPTIYDLVLEERMEETYVSQMENMCQLLYEAKMNIDYFSTNFVVQEETIYYIDFECNEYHEEWDFEHWGKKYWSKTTDFLEYVKKHS